MKKILNEANNKLNKIDYIFLTIIIVIYSILSFINLGDLKAPQTHYNIIKNEMVTVELKNPDDIIKMKFYNTEQTSTYQIDISEDNINYTSSGMVEGNGAFAWTEFKILGKAKYIRITSLENSSLGELAFYNNGGNIVTINKIYSNYKDIKELTDEQDTIPRNINYMNSSYFDEVYFARTAYEYINNLNIYEWTHPPLGKLIQAIPIKISNTMAPFYYRFMGNIAGILMIPIMYLLGKELFKKRKYAIASSLLILLDNFHFAQTRMGTVDSYLVLFIMLSFYFMFRFIILNGNESKDQETKQTEFHTIGFVATVFNLMMYSSTFINIRKMMQTRSSDKLPIITIGIGILCTIIFMIQGMIQYSYFNLDKESNQRMYAVETMVSNGISFLSLSIQAGIWIFYFNIGGRNINTMDETLVNAEVSTDNKLTY